MSVQTSGSMGLTATCIGMATFGNVVTALCRWQLICYCQHPFLLGSDHCAFSPRICQSQQCICYSEYLSSFSLCLGIVLCWLCLLQVWSCLECNIAHSYHSYSWTCNKQAVLRDAHGEEVDVSSSGMGVGPDGSTQTRQVL